ncbi:hypothetical protein MS3_00010814 [Schistosoma haematobium]|uniref:G-protein coupled receptors family 2 profile 2 domain-containing protein n=1 Tax=Schistosoma haematobium TaxID=6185 RepID=A0A094ZUF4_SCHHA|nr:hypothetical protein MS3_00010814 [Schistosoma haematobium]KAH9585564.1 hypothetical protein MS3_00010814 [Schistosoma haematobium]CAH8522391.1 unnamed protein product [Schistosoma haematobium]CAH8525532.1 unnamed protein product [Schistosoma haematobium]
MWKYIVSIIFYFIINKSNTSINQLNDIILNKNLPINNTCNSFIAKCYCDELCIKKSDCCIDYPLYNDSLNDNNDNNIITTTCIKKFHYVIDNPNILEEYEDFTEEIYAISNCPFNTSKALASKCSQAKYIKIEFNDLSNIDKNNWDLITNQYISGIISNNILFHFKLSDIRAIAPVISLKTNRIYANIDCAQCHGEFKTIPGMNFNDYLKKYLKFYTVKIRCHLINNQYRICLLDTLLPPSYSRSCSSLLRTNITPLSIMNKRIKWHEFVALPSKYLGFNLNLTNNNNDNNTNNNDKSTILKFIESIFDILQLIITILSAICLCILLIIYSKTKSIYQKLSNQLIMGLSLSILCLLLIYLTLSLIIEQLNIFNRQYCVLIAFLIHYFFLCSFIWMLIFGMNLLNTFGGIHTCLLCITYIKLKITKSKETINSINHQFISNAMHSMVIQSAKRTGPGSTKSIVFSSLLSTILPFCFVIPAIVINEKTYPNECIHEQHVAKMLNNEVDESICTKSQKILSYLTPGFCPPEDCTRPWFTINEAFFLWFLAPTTVLLAFNCLVLIIVGTHIWFLSQNELNVSTGIGSESGTNDFPKQSRKMLKICFNLSIILGIVWIFQILASLLPDVPLIGRAASLVSSAQGAALTFTTTSNLKRKAMTTCEWTSIFTLSTSNTSGTNRNFRNWIKPEKLKATSSDKPDSNLQSTKCDDN